MCAGLYGLAVYIYIYIYIEIFQNFLVGAHQESAQ